MRMMRNVMGRPMLPTIGIEKNIRAHAWHAAHGRLPLWVVCGPATRDYPGRYVARLWVTLPAARPTRRVLAHDTLDELRSMLPPDLVALPRSPQDDPVIIESWM